MNKRYFTAFLILFALLMSVTPTANAYNAKPRKTNNPTSEDVILKWNRILVETVSMPGQQPATIVAARSFAMMHGAMFDAVNSIDGSYEPYLIDVPGNKNASIDAAAAQAARDLLASLYPSRAAYFDTELQASLTGLPRNRVQRGLLIGRWAAFAMLADRAYDGWTAPAPAYVLDPIP